MAWVAIFFTTSPKDFTWAFTTSGIHEFNLEENNQIYLNLPEEFGSVILWFVIAKKDEQQLSIWASEVKWKYQILCGHTK